MIPEEKQCLICLGFGCNGNCSNNLMQIKDEYYREQSEMKSKSLIREERRDKQKQLGWRKGWHR